MTRKFTVLLLAILLFIPIQPLAQAGGLGSVTSNETKFKQEMQSAKQSKAVQQLVKQLQKPMTERKKRVVLNYSGKWPDIYEDFDKALLVVLLADEYLAFDYRGYTYTPTEKNGKLVIDVTFNYYQTKNQYLYVKQQVKKIVKSVTKPAMTQHEKVKVLHDYIVDNVAYDFSLNQRVNAPFFALKGGETLCNGYAMLMYLLLKEAGIEARLISGEAGTGADKEFHAWNMVKLERVWYHLDVTWNDYDDGQIRYEYYLKSDAKMRRDHTWKKGGLNGDENPYPKATVDYFDKLFAEDDVENLTLFDLWRDPETTAYSLTHFEELLTNQFNILQDEFTIDLIDEVAVYAFEDIEGYLAGAADGLPVRYSYEVERYDYLNTLGMRVTVKATYDLAVDEVYFDNVLQAGKTVRPVVKMKRTDGAEYEVTPFVDWTFLNSSLITTVNGSLRLRAPGTTEATFELDGETFEHVLTISGQTPLEQAANGLYPVDGFKNMQQEAIVSNNKQWIIKTSKAITTKTKPIVRVFDTNGRDVLVKVRFGDKKIVITAPDGGYLPQASYKLFVQFEHYPNQNSSARFDVAS
ncbi:MAG: transglutaminase domain-containing protein [Lysinibacillus sp.]